MSRYSLSLAASFVIFLSFSIMTACGDSDSKEGATGGSGGQDGTPDGSGGNDAGDGSGGAAMGGGDGDGAVVGPALPSNDTTAAPEREGFTLLFADQFDTLDLTRWQTASHTFTENAAQFNASMVNIVDGYLELRLQKAATPSAEGREYVGGELRTIDFFSYGRFETRARFAPGSGVVSSLFTYYDHWASADLEENWNEIDIEFLGKDTDSVQFNVIHWNASNQRTMHEHHSTTAYNPSLEFHDYAIEWLPDEVNFYIDEVLVHSQTEAIAEFVTLEQRVMMNVWPVIPSLSSWAGVFDENALPTAAYYDWVRVYAYDE